MGGLLGGFQQGFELVTAATLQKYRPIKTGELVPDRI